MHNDSTSWKVRGAVYLIAFISGCALLGLELVASRILAPFFGNSIYVWGALISVFLLALSLGYYLGGIIADRLPSFNSLGRIIMVTAFFICLIPFLAHPLSYGILTIGCDLRLAVLLASLGLFLVPSVLMGMVSPYVIKLSATRLERIGKTAGNVYAVSTIGSITGAILVAFFLVPLMGSRNIVFLLAGMLVLAAVLCLFSDRAMSSVTAS